MKERQGKKSRSVIGFLRALLAADVITMLILLLLSFILYKWSLSENAMRLSTLGTYMISCLIGGVLLGKSGRTRAFVWGLGLGLAYYMCLLLIALLIPAKQSTVEVSIMLNMAICMMSGMTGAMIVRK